MHGPSDPSRVVNLEHDGTCALKAEVKLNLETETMVKVGKAGKLIFGNINETAENHDHLATESNHWCCLFWFCLGLQCSLFLIQSRFFFG